MTNSDNHRPASFADWCKTSGLDRDFVRRNYAALLARYELDPTTPTQGLPPPSVRPRDRYDEI